MMALSISIISILLQLTAALLSPRLIRETGKLLAWALLPIAFTLMAARQIITLADILVGGNVAPLNLAAEIVALAISILMVSAVLAAKPVLRIIQLKNARFSVLLERSINEIYIFDAETLRFTDVSRGARENLGYSLKKMKSMTPLDIKPEFTRDSFEELISPLRNGEQEQIIFETLHRRKDGTDYPIEVRLHLSMDTGPKVIFAVILDITERRHVEQALKESQQRLRTAIESMATGIIVIDESATITEFNAFAEKMFGYKAEETIGRNVSMLMPEPDRSHHDQYVQSYLDTGVRNIIGFSREIAAVRKNGEEFPAHLGIGEIVRSGKKVFVGAIADISQRKQAEQALKESEGRLRQAQKLEAVGQLTGGVAHDFNNLLAIIEGNLSLLEEDLEDGRELNRAEVRKFVLPALRAGRRGAELTHRLLAFSRKQALQPEALDINKIVEGMGTLLRRTLGEDIDLGWHLEASGWRAETDAAELENVLLNLVLNARDAMPDGGRLTIETGEVTLDDEYAETRVEVRAGDYVMLAVTDTGAGMDADTLEKVFEPYFTTKDVGKGTGLGLSMVYGFAKQSGGHVAIYSQPGEGTTVRLYLPRTAVTETKAVARDRNVASEGGREIILVVEDDEDVRDIATRILRRLGYTVFEAADGPAARDILENEGAIDLLLTDVVLPGGMSGSEVAMAAQEKAPGLKVLYMSGYTENAILHHGRLDPGVNLIGKPFSHSDLGAKVREVLESST